MVRLTDVVAEPALVDPDGTDDASLAAQSLDGWTEYLESLSVTLGAGEYVGDAVAVADLDAVDPDRWRDVLARLAGEPDLRRALLEPARGERGQTAPSYTAWWLRSRGPAELGGVFAVEGTTSAALLPAAPDVLRGLDASVQVALGGIGPLDDLGPEVWVRVLDALGPAGTPVDAATAIALWRGISATASRHEAARGIRRSASRPSSRPDGWRWCMPTTRPWRPIRCGGSAPTSPRWCRRPPARAEALARLLDVPVVSELAAGVVDREQDGVVTPVPAEVAVVLPGAPTTWIEHEELSVDGSPVDWWVSGTGPTAVVRTVHVAGLAAGLAQAAGRWWARSAVEAVLVAPERAAELALDAVLDVP